MANIPGATNVLPGVFTDVITQSRGVSIPGGTRLAAVIGEGSTDETLVVQANGGGNDGFDPTYTTTQGADGRHFRTTNYPLISNRTTLFKNGVKLTGLEGNIDGNPFSNKYDYKVDPSTGKIELQKAYIVDQGGQFYVPLSTNVGDGYIFNLTLEDENAPPETWTVRCISVQRNTLNQPIAGTAKFLAFGSVSGSKLDANGNPIVWVSDGYTVSNGVLSFAISETYIMAVPISAFREGDAFVIKVNSGVLVSGDSLTVNYIPELFLNDPEILQGLGPVVNKHGIPSLTNNLSLGSQLAFSNAAPAVIAVQAAPPMPRRQDYILAESVNSTSTNNDDFIFPLPAGVTPDFNSNIHFFIKNNATNVETQILPNKFTYYTVGEPGEPTLTQFIQSTSAVPGGYAFSYTVVRSFENLATGEDGYVGRDNAFTNKGVFSSSIIFDSTYVGKTLKVIDATNVANNGTYLVDAVIDGKLYVTHETFPEFVNGSSIAFEVLDLTTNLPVSGGSATDGVLTAIVSTDTGFLASNIVTGVDFSSISGLLNKKLKINGTTSNDGVYDIIAFNSITNTITIKKALVNEYNLRYEVLNLLDESNYVVVNKSVVPSGYGLRVNVVDAKEASFYDAGWVNALKSLEKVDCDIVVPLPKQTISVIFQNALAHCRSMSNIRNKKERVLFIGAINGLKPENLIPASAGGKPAAVEDIGVLEGIQGETLTDVLAGNIEDLANYSVPDAFGNTYRAVYFYPDQIVVQAGADSLLIDGFYLAAAAAGYLSADLRVENPLTNKVLSGFTILRNKQFSTFTLEQLAQAGVCTLQPVTGGGRVIWGITTTQSGFPEEQEISIIFIRDRLAKALRAGFAGYIGTPETQDTPALLNTQAVVLLNSFISQGLITNYKDLSVKRDDVDPRQWNIAVRVQPTYPINYIYIKVSVGQL